MSAHSKEPWRVVQRSRQRIEAHDGKTVAEFVANGITDAERQANRCRTVLCVSVCAGMADPAAEIAALRECAVALSRFMDYGDVFNVPAGVRRPYEQAIAALAKLQP